MNRFSFSRVSNCGYIGKRVHGHTDRRTRTHGHLWKRRIVMEKTDTYGKDGHLWKLKTDSCGKDGHLWKRRTLMEKTDT